MFLTRFIIVFLFWGYARTYTAVIAYIISLISISLSSMLSDSIRCMTYPCTYFHIWWRGSSTMRHIEPSVTNNSLRMIFTLQIRTYLQHKCRMNWKKKISIIYLFPTNNGVTFSPPWLLKIINRELHLISKYLQPLRQHRTILIVIHLQRCTVRRSQGLVS